jgi:hypothetical protein
MAQKWRRTESDPKGPAARLHLQAARFEEDHRQAELWAKKVLADTQSSTSDRVTSMYTSALGRPPSALELTEAVAFLDEKAPIHGHADDPCAWSDLGHVSSSFTARSSFRPLNQTLSGLGHPDRSRRVDIRIFIFASFMPENSICPISQTTFSPVRSERTFAITSGILATLNFFSLLSNSSIATSRFWVKLRGIVRLQPRQPADPSLTSLAREKLARFPVNQSVSPISRNTTASAVWNRLVKPSTREARVGRSSPIYMSLYVRFWRFRSIKKQRNYFVINDL